MQRVDRTITVLQDEQQKAAAEQEAGAEQAEEDEESSSDKENAKPKERKWAPRRKVQRLDRPNRSNQAEAAPEVSLHDPVLGSKISTHCRKRNATLQAYGLLGNV